MNRSRSLGALACAGIISLGTLRADPPDGTAGWVLSFEDNFNGTSIDSSKWSAPSRQDGAPWNYQTPANAQVANGILTQVVTRRDASTYNISEIETRDRFEPIYAYFEARVKTSWSPSSWPSFWTVSRFGWPPELDIFENWGGANASMSAQNWHYRNAQGGEQGDAKGVWLPTSHPDYWGAGWGGDYHVYGAHWQEGKIDFYIDGVLTHTSTKEVTSLPMYVILSNGLGGGEHGAPDFSEGPADKYNMKTDYVRVWTRPLGTELSRSGWVASASASGPWNPPSNAIDGDIASKWGSGTSQFNGQWFQVDLGAARTFDTLVVKSHQNTGDAPAGVQVFVSDNATSWGSAIASKTDDATIQELNTLILKFGSQTKRYLRIVQTGTKSNWWGIDDLRLYTGGGGSGGGGGGGSGDGSPYGGTARAVPGTIQAEDFNTGGQNVAVFDNDSGNNGNSYRTTEPVDIEPCSDTGGGFNLGWVGAGEWLKYSVNVTDGTYNLTLRVASTGTGSARLEFGGVTKATFALPNTGGWQNWQNVTVNNVALTGGAQIMRLVIESGGANINHILVGAGSGGGGTGAIANGTYKVLNRNSGKALDVGGVSTADGAGVQQWTYGGGSNQRWTIEVQSDGAYKITAMHSGKSLAIDGGSTADGARVIQWPYGGQTDQRWKIESAGGGYYRVVNVRSNKCLDVTSASTADGASCVQWPSNGGNNQQWTFTAP
jgi:beta-glucanase (GH16 family)